MKSLCLMLFFFPLQSVLKNMKPELETSPDNVLLNFLSKETPRAPTACEGETGETLNHLDKVWRKMSLINCSFFSSGMNMISFMGHAISFNLFYYQTCLSVLIFFKKMLVIFFNF